MLGTQNWPFADKRLSGGKSRELSLIAGFVPAEP